MRRSKLSTMSIADLRQEIERRQKLLPKLIAQRDALSREIAELQGFAAPEAAPKKTRRRRRAKNKVGLADALAGFLKGKKKVTIGEVSRRSSTAARTSLTVFLTSTKLPILAFLPILASGLRWAMGPTAASSDTSA